MVLVLGLLVFGFQGCGGGGGGGGSDSTINPLDKDDTLQPSILTGSSYERHTTYSTYGDNDGEIESYSLSVLDSKGRTIQEIEYTDAGADNTWYTADDIVDNYYMQSYDDQGELQEWVYYEGMGKDGKWFTADDLCTWYYKIVSQKGTTKRYAQYNDPGADGTWRTDDDWVSRWGDVTFDEAGRLTEEIWYRGGSDGTISSDDSAYYHQKYTYTANGQSDRYMYSNGIGADLTWFTADDEDYRYTVYSYDADGRRVEATNYDSSGTGTSKTTWSYEDGRVVKRELYTSNGDGQLTLYSYETQEYDAQGNCMREVSYTSDDKISAYYTYVYDTNGKLVEEENYFDAGDDGDWKTEDDVIAYKSEYLSQLDIPTGAGEADTTAPTVTSSSPADKATGVSVTPGSMYIELSEDVICYRSQLTISGIPGLEKDNVSYYGNELDIDLYGIVLTANTPYTLTISGLMDKSGNVMPATTISFTTGAADTTAPVISYSNPYNDEDGVSTTIGQLYVGFNEQIVFDSSMLAITPAISGFASSRVSYSYKTVFIDLSGLTLAAGTTYTLTFTDVKDWSDNVMPATSISFTTASATASGYTLIDLGTLGGNWSYASGINNSGKVVGNSYNSSGVSYAFLYSNGTMNNIGKFSPCSINDSGLIVGSHATSGGRNHACLYTSGTITDIGTLGGEYSSASSINASGQIVGSSTISGTKPYDHAFLYNNGTMYDLGTLGGEESYATSINKSGQIVGTLRFKIGEEVVGNVTYTIYESHAFIYDNGTMTDLGTFGGTNSSAVSINDSGQIVGNYSTASSESHAFLYSNGIMTDLGTLGGSYSYAYSINNNGQVVGSSGTTSGENHIFLYSGGTMIDLNDLITNATGWTIEAGETGGINDLGQILCGGFYNGVYHAVLLTPQ